MNNKQNNSFDKQFKTKEQLQAYMIDVKKKSSISHTIGFGCKLIIT